MEIELGVLAVKDPVEIHIIEQLNNEKKKNNRLMSHIEKTGSWYILKETSTWKPYDFYHYFCGKYRQRYKKEYKSKGNIMLYYNKIESFMQNNSLSNSRYKDFIDEAFSRYFTSTCIPEVSSICSDKLYAFLFGKRTKAVVSKDLFDLDEALIKDNEEFEKNYR